MLFELVDFFGMISHYRNDGAHVCSIIRDQLMILLILQGLTNVLKLVSTGDGGLDELIEDFNPGKIQYAFLKVEDPKTSLPKFVLINWQVG